MSCIIMNFLLPLDLWKPNSSLSISFSLNLHPSLHLSASLYVHLQLSKCACKQRHVNQPAFINLHPWKAKLIWNISKHPAISLSLSLSLFLSLSFSRSLPYIPHVILIQKAVNTCRGRHARLQVWSRHYKNYDQKGGCCVPLLALRIHVTVHQMCNNKNNLNYNKIQCYDMVSI